MNLRVATPELVTQRVRTVLKDRPGAGVIAVRAEPTWSAGTLAVGDRDVQVQPCTSPLAVRASLAAWEDTHGDTAGRDLLVLLCDLSERDLGVDVIARLTPPRVLSLEPWDAVRSLFGAQRVDAAFGKEDSWVAGALLAHVPQDLASTTLVGTTLTKEVAYGALARQILGAPDLGVDALIDAAADPGAFAKLADLDPDVQDGILSAIGRQSGPLGVMVAAILRAGHGEDLLAIGLAARSVYGDGYHDGGKAAGKLEALCVIDSLQPSVGAALAQRCEERVRTVLLGDLDRANEIMARASALSDKWEAANPEASDLLPSGFQLRITAAVGHLLAILALLDEGTPADASSPAITDALAALRASVTVVAEHTEQATPAGHRRYAHLEMAARLVTWLASGPAIPSITDAESFEDAAARYATGSAWVDRARRRLWRGDDDAEVAAVYRTLIDRVVDRRRAENHRFADLLASWSTTPSSSTDLRKHSLITVETVVHEVVPKVGPLPVLLVVLDGCGLPSFNELAPQFARAGFREIAPSAAGDAPARRLAGIAACPTVTEVSRASLIAGALTIGNQDAERKAFEALAVLAREGTKPRFFHQNKLLGAAGESLSADVQQAVGPDGPAIVGVVINTIDDQLRKGTFPDELRLGDLHALDSLLEAARNAGRAVVISADHGHVLAQPDDGGTGAYQGGGDGGERWREADRVPNDTEVLLRGPRVLRGGDKGILAPWEDDFRYAAKAGGYHGGATPEEVLVPVAAYLPAGIAVPNGWQLFTEVPPLWWEVRTVPATADQPEVTAKAAKKPAKPVAQNQPAMFDIETPATPVAPAVPTAAQPAWLDALLASEVWAAQKSLAGRASLPEDRVREVISCAVRRGGVATFAAIGSETSVPQIRLAGFLANLARVLNVDGYAVLDVDGTAQEIRLSTPTLAQQFQIQVHPS
jgi:hypothetical protein